jgi:hypothetical protein
MCIYIYLFLRRVCSRKLCMIYVIFYFPLLLVIFFKINGTTKHALVTYFKVYLSRTRYKSFTLVLSIIRPKYVHTYSKYIYIICISICTSDSLT